MWKEFINKTVLSIQITINEITGVSDSILLSRPHLAFPSLTSLGRITPVFAQARLSTLLSILQTLFQKIPPTCGIPIFPLISTLLSLLAVFVPKGRRNDEASIDGIALSPKEQWLVFPLLFPQVFEVRKIDMNEGIGVKLYYQDDQGSYSGYHSTTDFFTSSFLPTLLQGI